MITSNNSLARAVAEGCNRVGSQMLRLVLLGEGARESTGVGSMLYYVGA